VGVATPGRLEALGFETDGAKDISFSAPSRPALGPTQLPVDCIKGLFPSHTSAIVW